MVMPLLSTGSKAIEGFADDNDATMLFRKFFTSNDANLLSCVGLKISIADVGCPEFQVVQFSKKHDHAETAKADHTRVDRLKRSIGEMPVSYWACLVSPIMLAIVDKVDTDSFVSFRCLTLLM